MIFIGKFQKRYLSNQWPKSAGKLLIWKFLWNLPQTKELRGEDRGPFNGQRDSTSSPEMESDHEIMNRHCSTGKWLTRQLCTLFITHLFSQTNTCTYIFQQYRRELIASKIRGIYSTLVLVNYVRITQYNAEIENKSEIETNSMCWRKRWYLQSLGEESLLMT